MQLESGFPVIGQPVQYPGNLPRDAGPHDYVIHACKHCPVQGKNIGQYYFFKQIDSYKAIMAFLCKIYLGKICKHG